jgi:hypothetical protein
MSKIVLKCVKEKSKLRIKFHSYTDAEGKVYGNAYDNNLNCMFPKELRVEGRFYEIEEDALELVARPGVKPFYRVVGGSIKVVSSSGTVELTTTVEEASVAKIYEIAECVVCLSDDSSEVLVPCGHKCMCKSCANQLYRSTRKCPICRKYITTLLSH